MTRLRVILLLLTCCALAVAVTAAPSRAALKGRRRRGPVLSPIPPRIPGKEVLPDPFGELSTFQPQGATRTKDNPFFQTLGSDPRMCATCHERREGYGLGAQAVQTRFSQSEGTDPLFNPIDAATCPTDDVSTPVAQQAAYRLVLEKALFRISLPIPPDGRRGFAVTPVNDPYACTVLASPTSGNLSVYRRVLPTTNLPFLTTIMWDGREPSLAHGALDEALVHEEAAAPGPGADQQSQIVNFETGLFTAQVFDNDAGSLKDKPTQLTLQTPVAGSSSCRQVSLAERGGPEALAALAQDFFVGINDPGGQNPCGTAFDDDVFDLFDSWSALSGKRRRVLLRASIARGEALFNTKPFSINDVGGLNGSAPQQAPLPANCAFCHDTPGVGNHSVDETMNTGTTDANPVGGLDVSDLPVFTLQCTDPASPLNGQTFNVTDPGDALVTGKCEDIGKVKVPILRGMAARAPYFHNGAAASLADVVNFYDARFSIGLTDQEKQDFVDFLQAL